MKQILSQSSKYGIAMFSLFKKNIVKSVGTDDLNPIYNWVDNFMILNLR